MQKSKFPITLLEEFLPTSTGHDILRYLLLPDLLGHNSDTLLYFSGRNLARKIKLSEINDIYYFFQKISWGHLELVREKKNELSLLLMSDEIVKRLESNLTTEFNLEAGFLAEAIENVTDRPSECEVNINKRLFQVNFKVIFTDLKNE